MSSNRVQLAQITLKQSSEPMMICKELRIPRPQVTAFFVGTMDKKAFLVHYWRQIYEFTSVSFQRKSEELVSDVYFDENSQTIYAGTVGGDIEGWPLKDEGCQYDKNRDSFHYMEKKDKYTNIIVLIYRKNDSIVTWDIESRIKVISIKTKEKLFVSRIKAQISAALAFKDPFSQEISACIAF